MSPVIVSLVLLSVLFNTIAQLALKAGMMAIGHFEFTLANFWPVVIKLITSPWLILGGAVYVGSLTTWLMVLSRVEVSVAYPMASLGYITSAIAAYFLYHEQLTVMKIIGIGVILLGVFLVARQ